MTQRTLSQNDSMHLLFAQVAEELNKNGYTFNDMVKAIQHAEVMPTPENVKLVFKALVESMYGHDKTSELETHQVDKVYETFNLWLAHHFELHIPFPDSKWEGLTNN